MEIVIANESHFKYAQIICDTISESAKVRGTGIAKRTTDYILQKLKKGNAVIALDNGNFVGFCYIEIWGHDKYVANSGLIVHPDYRNQGLAKKIKKSIFELSVKKFPTAKIFGITTGLAVMKINYELGYQPVTFSELTDDPQFWKGCSRPVRILIFLRERNKKCVYVRVCYTTPPKSNKKTKRKK